MAQFFTHTYIMPELFWMAQFSWEIFLNLATQLNCLGTGKDCALHLSYGTGQQPDTISIAS